MDTSKPNPPQTFSSKSHFAERNPDQEAFVALFQAAQIPGLEVDGVREVIFKGLTPGRNRFNKPTLKFTFEDTTTKTLVHRTVNAVLGPRTVFCKLCSAMIPELTPEGATNTPPERLHKAITERIGERYLAVCSLSKSGLYVDIVKLGRKGSSPIQIG